MVKISFLKIVFISIFFLLSFLPSVVSAGSGHNMSGWAWSSNIGWISFNSTSSGGSVDYGVNKNSDGTLTGYAWSSNIGWIQFGGLDTNSMPTGSGTQKINAKINGSNLQGWAKALSADGNGWDGWISLSGSNYGVTFNSATGKFSGYAWGSDVVGWVSFDVAGPTSGVACCSSNIPSVPTVTATTNPACGTGIINVSWVASGAMSYTLKVDNGTPISMGNVTTYSHTGLTAGSSHNYSVLATNNVGSSIYSSVVTGVAPAACGGGPYVLTLNKIGTGTITSSVGNINCGATTCYAVYAFRTSVVLNVASGTLSSWSGACSGAGSSCTVIMNSDKTVTATFTAGGGSRACSIPSALPRHYLCSDGNPGTNQRSLPSQWIWECGTQTCSENGGPGYIED